MRFRFGSFNMFNMAAYGEKNYQKIAEIIRQEDFDVVAFQEILSEGKALEFYVMKYLPNYDFKWVDTTASSTFSFSADQRGEGFAFAWKKNRLQLASSATKNGTRVYEPRKINEEVRDSSSIFFRQPLYARFVPIYGGFFEFRLINIHLYFGNNNTPDIVKRKAEYNYLVNRIYPTISTERRYGNNREAYTIIMGDYNLNLCGPRNGLENKAVRYPYIEEPEVLIGNQIIRTVQDELTTLKSSVQGEALQEGSTKGYSQNYDHFTFDICVLEEEGIKYKARRIDAVKQYYNEDFVSYRHEISDHVPIVLELAINET